MTPWRPLSSRKEFLRVLKTGERAEAELLFLRLLWGGKGRRIGFSTRRGFKNAVGRNRAKRWMREGIRRHLAQLPEDAGLVLVAKPEMQSADFHGVASELRDLLGRVMGASKPQSENQSQIII